MMPESGRFITTGEIQSEHVVIAFECEQFLTRFLHTKALVSAEGEEDAIIEKEGEERTTFVPRDMKSGDH